MGRARADLGDERRALEEGVRERVVEEGPGEEAMKAVGLVRVVGGGGGGREVRVVVAVVVFFFFLFSFFGLGTIV